MHAAEFYRLKAERLAQLASQLQDTASKLEMLRTAANFETLSRYALRNGTAPETASARPRLRA